jgi:hypothetical protein
MALKPITLRLDEEEYERLKASLSKFGDPDINVAYVVRAYIRDLNRIFPAITTSGWDLKNYFGFLGMWLKQMVSMSDMEVFTKGMFNWWPLGQPRNPSPEGGADGTTPKKENLSPARKKGGDDEDQGNSGGWEA